MGIQVPWSVVQLVPLDEAKPLAIPAPAPPTASPLPVLARSTLCLLIPRFPGEPCKSVSRSNLLRWRAVIGLIVGNHVFCVVTGIALCNSVANIELCTVLLHSASASSILRGEWWSTESATVSGMASCPRSWDEHNGRAGHSLPHRLEARSTNTFEPVGSAPGGSLSWMMLL